MKVSIVILCYNEKDTIEKIVEAVCNASLKSREKLLCQALPRVRGISIRLLNESEKVGAFPNQR